MKTNITRWMKENAALYLDDCGAVNMTELAEAAARNLDLYGPPPKYEIPEDVFETAFKVSEWYEDFYVNI